jgi:hypothetical protein
VQESHTHADAMNQANAKYEALLKIEEQKLHQAFDEALGRFVAQKSILYQKMLNFEL